MTGPWVVVVTGWLGGFDDGALGVPFRGEVVAVLEPVPWPLVDDGGCGWCDRVVGVKIGALDVPDDGPGRGGGTAMVVVAGAGVCMDGTDVIAGIVVVSGPSDGGTFGLGAIIGATVGGGGVFVTSAGAT
jgi:hypothetical protein